MNKIFYCLLLFFFLSFKNSYAEIVKKVEINGNQRISNETIIVLGNISLNKNFDDSKLNNSLKSLYDTNFFSSISMSVENGILTINLIENPIIENIEIIGVKSESFVQKISESMKLKERMSFSEDQLKKDVTFIKNIFKTNGFYFTTIKSSVVKNDKLNSIQLKLEIEQGKKAKIKEIIFIGDKKIKDKKLLEVVASEEHKFWKFVSNKVYLNQSLIELDKRLLENYYKNLGYYNVKILNSFAEFNNESYFKLVFNIEAGKKYFFNDFKLILPDDYRKSDFKKVEKIFNKIKTKQYSIDNVNLILKEIDKIASARLYDFINADVEESIVNDNKINFTFKVSDSEKFYVERINIFGNFNTIEEVIRNKFIVDEGDPLNNLLYNKSIDNIKSLGIFKKVDYKIIDGSNDNLKIVNLNVEEQPTGEVSLAAGVGTSGSTIGGGLTEKNFLGKGISLTTNLEFSEDSVKGQFVYSKPNFAYTDNTLFTSVKSTTKDNLSNCTIEYSAQCRSFTRTGT